MVLIQKVMYLSKFSCLSGIKSSHHFQFRHKLTLSSKIRLFVYLYYLDVRGQLKVHGQFAELFLWGAKF